MGNAAVLTDCQSAAEPDSEVPGQIGQNKWQGGTPITVPRAIKFSKLGNRLPFSQRLTVEACTPMAVASESNDHPLLRRHVTIFTQKSRLMSRGLAPG